MTRRKLTPCVLALGLAAFPGSMAWRTAAAATNASEEVAPTRARVERGAYIVRSFGCHDCHTPWKMGPAGPGPDMTRALSGHPADMVMPPPPRLEGAWNWAGAATNTAFAGPWGVSFAANLTPDPDTGLGRWNEDIFLATFRTARHEGKGRKLLPPMPVQWIGLMDEDDLRSVFAYLQSLPPVRNRVPAPIDPPESRQ
jgi:cytochrome c2